MSQDRTMKQGPGSRALDAAKCGSVVNRVFRSEEEKLRKIVAAAVRKSGSKRLLIHFRRDRGVVLSGNGRIRPALAALPLLLVIGI